MRRSTSVGILAMIAIIVLGGFWFLSTERTPNSVQRPASYDDLISVDVPLPDSSVMSPLVISGKARGSWYFEASFPVKVLDADNKVLAQAPAQAQGDWMTTEYVPFTVTLDFTPTTATGTLVLHNDNPSGLPDKDKELDIPIRFVKNTSGTAFSADGNVTRNNPGQKPDVWYLAYEKPGSPGLSVELDLNSAQNPDIKLAQGERVHVEGTRRGSILTVQTITAISAETGTHIKLFYYDPALDQGPGGALCSAKGLTAVERVIPKTATPLKDSIQLLLRGEMSDEEHSRGITSEFPLPGVSLSNASIVNGVATLTFSDPAHKTSGGSCRASILRAQVEATARQFSSVTSVRFMPADTFQP